MLLLKVVCGKTKIGKYVTLPYTFRRRGLELEQFAALIPCSYHIVTAGGPQTHSYSSTIADVRADSEI